MEPGPNEEVFRAFLGDHPEEVSGLDPYVPESWHDEPGFMAATRLELGETPQPLPEGSPFINEVRTVEIEGVEIKYLLTFLKEGPQSEGR